MEPTSCDNCSNNFLSHNIEWCPNCDDVFCDNCMGNHGCGDEETELEDSIETMAENGTLHDFGD